MIDSSAKVEPSLKYLEISIRHPQLDDYRWWHPITRDMLTYVNVEAQRHGDRSKSPSDGNIIEAKFFWWGSVDHMVPLHFWGDTLPLGLSQN